MLAGKNLKGTKYLEYCPKAVSVSSSFITRLQVFKSNLIYQTREFLVY